jgi:hypothetical protein
MRIVAAAARSSTSCAMSAAISAMTLAVTSPAWYAARCGATARPVAFWVRPTALTTVVRIATPAAVPSWRPVLNRVEAAPVAAGVMVANAAACRPRRAVERPVER